MKNTPFSAKPHAGRRLAIVLRAFDVTAVHRNLPMLDAVVTAAGRRRTVTRGTSIRHTDSAAKEGGPNV